MTDHWVLCVDDEPKVLEGLDLQLSFDYTVRTADGGAAGLELLRAHPNCATIISDMRMPGMTGAEFLSAARKVVPDTTRMLLTGFTEVDDAIAAINKGGIFRFLTKPTPPDVLKIAVEDGIRQWQLIQSERVLLEQTLNGAVKALIEALEIASPEAFSRARRIEAISKHAATEMGLKPVWEVALAGLLLRLGWIAVPSDTITGFLAGRQQTASEAEMLEAAYATSARLVDRIPRLDNVATIINQAQNPSGEIDAATTIRTVAEFDQLCRVGHTPPKAIKALDGSYPREILVAINSWPGTNEDAVTKEVTVRGLVIGMTTEQDVLTTDGSLLIQAGTDLSETVIQRLRNFSTSRGVQEPIVVSARRA